MTTVTTVQVKRALTETTIELRAQRALTMGLRLVGRSVLALLRGRRLRLTFKRAGVGEDTRAFAIQIAEERRAAAPVRADDGSDDGSPTPSD